MSTQPSASTKEKLDDAFLGVIGNLLRLCDQVPAPERRAAILGMFNLPPQTTNEEVERLLRKDAQNFEQPVDPQLVDRLVQMVMDKLKANP